VQQATISTEDQAAIGELLDRMREAWERGDADAYASVFSDDSRYVNAPGTRTIGRQAIAESHQKVFDTVLAHTHLGRTYPSELQPLTSNVVVVHASGAVLFPGEHEEDVAPNGLITIVAARDGDAWQLVSFSNTPTGRARNIKFALRFLRFRLALLTKETRKAKAHMLQQKRENMTR
jgi:uncharacterized protein (TIGR02246 family)